MIKVQAATAGANPDASLCIFMNGLNSIVTQGCFILRVVTKTREFPGFWIQLVQAAFECADPQLSVAIFQNGVDIRPAQTVGVFHLRAVMDEFVGLSVEAVQAGGSAHP